MKNLEIVEIESWETAISPATQDAIVKALEGGKVVYFPKLSFNLGSHELPLLSPDKTDPKSKNVSFDIRTQKLAGAQCSDAEKELLAEMIKRFAVASRKMMETLIPSYNKYLEQARTSFRPVEIEGRKTSYRKDDSLLHIDSFPATPSKGKRILRFFSNINQEGKSRVWRIGEPFSDVVKKMGPRTSSPFPGLAELYKLLRITKDYRTLYDHYMLQLHDNMKADSKYQEEVPQETVLLPPGSTWMVYTDQVSHAAMSGQHVLEQTYHLPPSAMQNLETTPLAVLEKYFKKILL